MKRIKLLIILSLLALCFIPLTAFSYVLGDANDDGLVNILDALIIARYSAAVNPPCEFGCGKADVNCDGTININDALMIARYSAGLIKTFPCSSAHTLELTISYESGDAPTAEVLVSPPGVRFHGRGIYYIQFTEPLSVTLTGSEYWYDTHPGSLTSVETLYPDWDDNPTDGKLHTMMKYIEGYAKVRANFIHASAYYPTPSPTYMPSPTPVPTVTPIPSPPYTLEVFVNRDYTLPAGETDGDVTVSPPGVTIYSSRTIVFTQPTMVYLRATESYYYYYGYVLSSWSGPLESISGTTAAVYVDRAKSVTAYYTKKASDKS